MKIPPKPTTPPPGPNLDDLLSNAIEKALSEGKGWSTPAEREEYLNKIGDDDFLPPIFCETPEEVARSGLSEALTSLIYEGEDPGRVMSEFKKKGNEAFANGKKNVKKNVQYYRDAVNSYHEAIGWCDKIVTIDADTSPVEDEDNDIPTFTNSEAGETVAGEEQMLFTNEELTSIRSTLYSNIALAHLQLKNYGFARNNAVKATEHDSKNIKAWYRLAKSHQMLKNFEQCGDAIDSGLTVSKDNPELLKITSLLSRKIQIARNERKRRQRARMQRIQQVKQVWKHCQQNKFTLGRIPLISLEDVEDEEYGTSAQDTTWKYNYPFSGKLPFYDTSLKEFTWPCLFIYPTHQQSDFIEHMSESEMLALRLANMFPELEDGQENTTISWDYNNEFICSNLEVYYEIHSTTNTSNHHHPEAIQKITNQETAIKFYESCRAIQGEDGPDMVDLVSCVERKRLKMIREECKVKNKGFVGYLDPCDLVRIHPAGCLNDILRDARVIVPNFVVTFYLFPMGHPMLKEYLKEHKCVDIIQPSSDSTQLE